MLPGALTIPAVAYDSSAAGLSGDGRRLVLIQPRVTFPRKRTGLAVLDTQSLVAGRWIDLRGDFSFDAVSPHGGLVYLIQYLSRIDPTKYARPRLRRSRRPAARAPGRRPERAGRADGRHAGQPRERRGGRWAYTLYAVPGATPFVHALDTAKRTARCIDLDRLAGHGRLVVAAAARRRRAHRQPPAGAAGRCSGWTHAPSRSAGADRRGLLWTSRRAAFEYRSAHALLVPPGARRRPCGAGRIGGGAGVALPRPLAARLPGRLPRRARRRRRRGHRAGGVPRRRARARPLRPPPPVRAVAAPDRGEPRDRLGAGAGAARGGRAGRVGGRPSRPPPGCERSSRPSASCRPSSAA